MVPNCSMLVTKVSSRVPPEAGIQGWNPGVWAQGAKDLIGGDTAPGSHLKTIFKDLSPACKDYSDAPSVSLQVLQRDEVLQHLQQRPFGSVASEKSLSTIDKTAHRSHNRLTYNLLQAATASLRADFPSRLS